jgi:DNA-binding transcriptional regulator GbsR (MarR family)
MDDELQAAKENFIQGMSRIGSFWGFPKAMGAIYGVIYLSPDLVGLDELVEQAGVSKGAVSTNVRTLERLGMVHKKMKFGDRKDYYTAEADMWKIVRGVLKEREKTEFGLALDTVGESLQIVKTASEPIDPELNAFYKERMEGMQSFFKSLDSMVAAFTALDNLRVSTLPSLFRKATESG